MSDAIIDTLKMVKDPPKKSTESKAQIEKNTLPQSGSPMSDVIIDTFKMVKDPPKKQSEVQTSSKTTKSVKPAPVVAGGNANSTSVAQKSQLPQSGSPMSDVIIDTFKMVKDPPKKNSEV